MATRARSRRWLPIAGIAAVSLIAVGAFAGPSLFASAGQTPAAEITHSAPQFSKGSASAPAKQAASSATSGTVTPETPADGSSGVFVPLPCPDGSTPLDSADGAALPCETPSGYPGG